MTRDSDIAMPGDAPDICAVDRCLGVVTLHRPERRNAVTPGHCRSIGRALQAWAKSPQIYAAVVRSQVPGVFCAGADMKEAIAVHARDAAEARRNLASEYRCVWSFDCFSKPTVALIDGLIMGSAVGLSHFGTHRVAGEGYAFSVPECALGLVPDVGQAWVLSRLTGHTGAYLALTGHRILARDAFRVGLVTHVIGRATHPAIIAGLADADPVDPLLDRLHALSGPSELESQAGLIDDCFSADTVPGILQRLGRVNDAGRDFARAAVASVERGHPLAQAAALHQIRRAGDLDLRQTLIDDYRIALRMGEIPGLAEGRRAKFIDKSATPWSGLPRDIDQAAVDALFAPLGPEDLQLPTRREFQTNGMEL